MSPDFSNPMTFYLQSQLKTQDAFHDFVNTKNHAARCILGRITTMTDISTNGGLFLINSSEKNCSSPGIISWPTTRFSDSIVITFIRASIGSSRLVLLLLLD